MCIISIFALKSALHSLIFFLKQTNKLEYAYFWFSSSVSTALIKKMARGLGSAAPVRSTPLLGLGAGLWRGSQGPKRTAFPPSETSVPLILKPT